MEPARKDFIAPELPPPPQPHACASQALQREGGRLPPRAARPPRQPTASKRPKVPPAPPACPMVAPPPPARPLVAPPPPACPTVDTPPPASAPGAGCGGGWGGGRSVADMGRYGACIVFIGRGSHGGNEGYCTRPVHRGRRTSRHAVADSPRCALHHRSAAMPTPNGTKKSKKNTETWSQTPSGPQTDWPTCSHFHPGRPGSN